MMRGIFEDFCYPPGEFNLPVTRAFKENYTSYAMLCNKLFHLPDIIALLSMPMPAPRSVCAIISLTVRVLSNAVNPSVINVFLPWVYFPRLTGA
ncbi:MAG: hypothetical protein MZV63_29690 [Marinilabiliales bacterium]|nr:hypothetical protein [Marinilabiliales bacterium]